ncbi:uncharacterized protein LOC133526029 [Cydia pomonella]|uniref:uncharacterized protein LOC133526029 n=1 Tax=Cydia pomonella TaxID=82600 RepID=UPI002ADD881D|nr:uncharacterized protein LOC133526029 [Cydia pomonella]
MHGEAPEFKRCCFCLPLRRGLIAWGYTKLILNILAIMYVGFITYIYAVRSWRPSEARTIVILAFMYICLLLDIAFDIIFIFAGHKRNEKLLKISYIYNIVWLGLLTLGNCFQVYLTFSISYRMWFYIDIQYRKYIILDVLTSSGIALSLISVQIYLILLIRSEIIKLRQQTLGMQYTNYTASGEPQCTLHNTSDHYTDKKQAVQDCCTDKKQGMEDCCTDKEQGTNCCTKEKCNKGFVA